jgi:hypothetical protein
MGRAFRGEGRRDIGWHPDRTLVPAAVDQGRLGVTSGQQAPSTLMDSCDAQAMMEP